MPKNPFPFHGLSTKEVTERKKDVSHKVSEQNELLILLKDTVFEPVFILLIASAGVYLLLGELSDQIP